MAERVSLKELAERLGLSRPQASKYARKVSRELGISPKKGRTHSTGKGPPSLTFTRTEADRIVEHREASFPSPRSGATAVPEDLGSFYVVQLVPDLDPRRLKLGFAADVEQRLREHRTAAPTAVVRQRWPCRRHWERTAIDCATASQCRTMTSEVFECDEVDALVRRLDEFFALLPDPNSDPPGWSIDS